jgi:hypothetical protein
VSPMRSAIAMIVSIGLAAGVVGMMPVSQT